MRHRWRYLRSDGDFLSCTCDCKEHVGKTVKVELDQASKALHKRWRVQAGKETNALFKTLQTFRDEFCPTSDVMVSNGEWVLQGYDLIEAVEKWARRKKYVHTLAASRTCLLLFEHRNRYEYYGTTVFYISSNQAPVEFFLHPDQARDLVKVLRPLGSAKVKGAPERPSDRLYEKFRGRLNEIIHLMNE